MPYFEVQLTNKLQRIYDVGPDTLIGRAPQCHIQLLSRAVSRRHARIEFDGTQAIISDMGTKNGIKLNGQRIQGAAVVGEGDVILVGDIKMRFRATDRTAVPANVIDLRNRPATPQDVQASSQPMATFMLRASPEAIEQFQATVARGRIALLELDELSRFKMQIALKEALENSRRHGCQGDTNRFMYVTFEETADEFVMSVRDEGQGYDVEGTLRNCQEVDALQAVRDRHQMGGPMGLRIILSCVDRIQFEGQGNTIHMGRFKAAGQLFVISEDAVGSEPMMESSSSDENPRLNLGDPFGDLPPSDEGPIQMGDLF